jgi:nondiscriminating aspartyl-tRNA synthetase
MDLDEINDWRKTHFTKDINVNLKGKEVILGGWVQNYRDLGGLKFIILQDKFGERQITLKKGVVSDEIFNKKVGYQWNLMIKGNVKEFKKAPGGVEIIPTEIKILNKTPEKLPIDMTGETISELDIRLDNRVLDLRSKKNQAIFRIRSEVINSMRDFLFKNNFTEITTPKIIASATEGGTELFPIIYFEEEAFLTQSAQLYKEQLCSVFENVFEIGPSFRAEKSHTKRHLCEIVQLDVEMAFAKVQDVLKLLEEMIHFIIINIREKRIEDLEFLKMDKKTIVPELPFPRYSYEEILNILSNKSSINIEFGEDLSTEALRKLDAIFPGYYYIVDWPTSIKPFYIMPYKDRPEFTESFDLQKGWLELASGGTRVHDKEYLKKRLEEKELNLKSFESHLRMYDFGMPPHAGAGFGMARFITVLCGLDDVREAVMYPRTPDRLTP